MELEKQKIDMWGDLMSKFPTKVLTPEDEANIRKEYKNGELFYNLMKKHKIGQQRLNRILDGRVPKVGGKVKKFMPMGKMLEANKKHIDQAKNLFESINVGDTVELKHKGEIARQNESMYYLTNVHSGTVIQKTDNQIFVQESKWKRQGISLSQILARQVDIRKVG